MPTLAQQAAAAASRAGSRIAARYLRAARLDTGARGRPTLASEPRAALARGPRTPIGFRSPAAHGRGAGVQQPAMAGKFAALRGAGAAPR